MLKRFGTTPASIGAQCVWLDAMAKRASHTLVFALSRPRTSARMVAGTPTLSTVTSTAGPSSSLPIASAFANSGCSTPLFTSRRLPYPLSRTG